MKSEKIRATCSFSLILSAAVFFIAQVLLSPILPGTRKITVTHTHDVGTHSHHHDHQASHKHHHQHRDETKVGLEEQQSEHDSSSRTHSHTIVVQDALNVTLPRPVKFKPVNPQNCVVPEIEPDTAHVAEYFASIFRPPILS